MAVWAAHETELLINLVRRNHTLYDPSSNDYRNRDVLKTLWNSIAREMDRSGRIFISEMDCRDRWNSLRDGYRRFVKDEQALPGGPKAKKKKTWHWSESMSFLKPYIQERTPTASATASNSNGQKKRQEAKEAQGVTEQLPTKSVVVTSNDTMCRNESTVVECNEEDANATNSSGNTVLREGCPSGGHDPRKCCDPEGKWEVTSSSVESAPVVNAAAPPPPPVQDPDEQFFRSLLPDVKVLTPRQKGMFKIQVQKLLQEMLYPKEGGGARTSAHGGSEWVPATIPPGCHVAHGNACPSESWTASARGGEYSEPHPS